MNDAFYVAQHRVTSPCFGQSVLIKVNALGNIEWEQELDGFRRPIKLVGSGDSVYLFGQIGDDGERNAFVSKFDESGELTWSHTCSVDFEVIPFDFIELQSGSFLLSYYSGSTFYFEVLNSDGTLSHTFQIDVAVIPQFDIVNLSQELGNHLIEATPGELYLAYNSGEWYEGVRFHVVGFACPGLTGYELISGCTDPAACNFSAEANSDDGSCVEAGCTDPAACNFVPEAGCDDGSCAPAEAVPGCMEAAACNYAAPCVYPPAGSADCGAGAAFCGEGMVWDAAQQTCLIDPAYVAGIAAGAAQGACGPWTVWDAGAGQCVGAATPACASDLSGNGSIGIEDLLILLSEFAMMCP
jgi:hypothetical protein